MREAAARVQILWPTFYRLIRKGVIPAEKQAGGWRLLDGWDEAAREWQAAERERLRRSAQNKIFAEAWRVRRNISLDSATTQIKRWRGAKLTDEDIRGKIGATWIEGAVHVVSKDGILTEAERQAFTAEA